MNNLSQINYSNNKHVKNNMKYSRKEIDRTGKKLLTSTDQNEVKEAIEKLNDWRSLHLVPLDILQQRITDFLSDNEVRPFLISRRLKRLTSIQYKLDMNPEMGLGGMQDIGGLRVVVNNVEELLHLQSLLINNSIDDFENRRMYDYVNEPKESGYRSIHFAYIYKSDDKVYNGLRIELQIRTRLQHLWATAVETAGLYTNTSLKSSQGESEWLEFFKIVSALFSYKEKLPVARELCEIGMKKLMVLCYKMNKTNQYSDILKALNVSVHETETEEETDNSIYYLIVIDFEDKTVGVTPFTKDQESIASNEYAKLEEGLQDGKNAAVLVSVNKVKELRKAYPSYFLDTKEFTNNIDKICHNCEVRNLL